MSDEQPEVEIIELVTLRYIILALALGIALAVGASVILARVGDDHADE